MEKLRELSKVEIILAFAASCVEAVARTMSVPYNVAYRKMKDADLFSRLIFPHYEVLHTESREVVVERIIERLTFD